MNPHQPRRRVTGLHLILLLVFSVLVIYPPLVSQAAAPYVYYALSNDPWSLMRRDSDGTNPVTVYTPPVDYARAVAVDHVDRLYFYDNESGAQTIYQSNLDGSGRTPFLAATINALAAGKGYVYYALTNNPWTLMRRNADGTNSITIYTPPVDVVREIAIDFTNDRLYFYDSQSGAQTIFKSDLDGSNRSTFVTANINALAVGADYVYYALSDSPWSLLRRNSDGSNPVTIYTPPTGEVTEIAVDPTGSRVYFYDNDGAGTLYQADLDGANRTTFLSARILALATHAERPTSVTLQQLAATEDTGRASGLGLAGLLIASLAGWAILRRKTAHT